MIFAGSEISDGNWRRAAKSTGGVLSVDILEECTKLWGVPEISEMWGR